MSKSRVFGQSVKIYFSADGGQTPLGGDSAGIANVLAEIQSFTAKDDPVIKENSSLGEAGIGSLDELDNGGTLSFEAVKSDSKLVSMFIQKAKHMRAGVNDGTRGRGVLFTVDRKVTYTDGSSETIRYVTTLHGHEESVSGNKEEVIEKFEGRYVSRKFLTPVTQGEATAGNVAGLNQTFIATAMKYFASINEQGMVPYGTTGIFG